MLVAAALVIVVGYLTAARYLLPKHSASARQAAQGSAADSALTGAVPDKSIAVLPFADLSEKKDQEYFSDGLSEELIDLLAKVPDLRVPARTSSFFFKGKTDDIATIGQCRAGACNVPPGWDRRVASTRRRYRAA